MHIEDLLKMAVERGASDLHLTVNAAPVVRVHGELRYLPVPVLTYQDLKRMAGEILNEEQKLHFEEKGELDFSYSIYGYARFRVNVFKQRGTPAIAARIIPPVILNTDELGLPEVVKTLVRKPNGLILVTGPTGSGKSTTLAAMIDQLNKERTGHIITLEDPIEFLHTHQNCIINQREIGLDSKTFAAGLRAALRQDPDVILVGEMRDLETIATAITAAETGHLVLATLHTAGAVQTIDRIIDVFPPHQQEQIRVQLALILQGVISQTLIPRADHAGRVPAVEVLVATPAVRNMIREGKTHQLMTAMQAGAKYGMQTMDQSLKSLYKKGLITYEEAHSRALDQDSFLTFINAV
ncbi:twitching motility protein [Thermincola ferriacetica]|uniref:Twitching motility protein n=1 Tax=Thermincola ferriacetica TaxID=281456 RepID=A0A0L6W523_9FIRM|nr:type IV pilus twitching motility protein PilT [Thermincola ferriacetica]KNZ70682.1 twitching motility protein [Thermincola ferriacetica]